MSNLKKAQKPSVPSNITGPGFWIFCTCFARRRPQVQSPASVDNGSLVEALGGPQLAPWTAPAIQDRPMVQLTIEQLPIMYHSGFDL